MGNQWKPMGNIKAMAQQNSNFYAPFKQEKSLRNFQIKKMNGKLFDT